MFSLDLRPTQFTRQQKKHIGRPGRAIPSKAGIWAELVLVVYLVNVKKVVYLFCYLNSSLIEVCTVFLTHRLFIGWAARVYLRLPKYIWVAKVYLATHFSISYFF